jgi:hypothetical protein
MTLEVPKQGGRLALFRSLRQEASNLLGDQLGRRHDRRVPLASQKRDPGVRHDGADPVGSLAPPVGALLAEQEEHRCGELREARGVEVARLLGSDLAGHGMRGCHSRGPRRGGPNLLELVGRQPEHPERVDERLLALVPRDEIFDPLEISLGTTDMPGVGS